MMIKTVLWNAIRRQEYSLQALNRCCYSVCLAGIHKRATLEMSRPFIPRSYITGLRLRPMSTVSDDANQNGSDEKDSVTESGGVDNNGARTSRAAASDTFSPQDLDEQLNKLTVEVATLRKQFDEMRDKYLRALAESENTRTRLHRQIQEAKQFGIQSFCKDLLPLADDLKRASISVDKAHLSENKALNDLFVGIEIIINSFGSTLRKHGLEEIETKVGQPFDPRLHEAVFQVPRTNESAVASNCVFDIVQTGYCLHNRVIRAAKVGVVA